MGVYSQFGVIMMILPPSDSYYDGYIQLDVYLLYNMYALSSCDISVHGKQWSLCLGSCHVYPLSGLLCPIKVPG